MNKISIKATRRVVSKTVFLASLLASTSSAFAHGDAGNRVFPATMVVEDPSVADELSLPLISRFNEGEEGWSTETEGEFSKRITDNFGLSVEAGYVDGEHEQGWENIELGAKYRFFKNDEHEFLLSAGLGWNIGDSGSSHVGESFSTLTPTLFFGKGFGDIGDGFALLRPFAVTGTAGVALPTRRHTDGEENPKTLEWGLTLQYSLPYLQQHVRDVGLTAPFDRITPVVEFEITTPFDSEDDTTTGTINPGLLWSGESFQIGAGAILPVNDESGDGVGARVQLHFFLDDIFPSTIGKPLWE